MDHLYLEIFNFDSASSEIDAPLETIIIYFIYVHCNLDDSAFNVTFVIRDNNVQLQPHFKVKLNKVFNVLNATKLPLLATYCTLPNLIVNNVTVVSGLSSVSRQIIKTTPENSPVKKLLGFREACLMACNESSVWTKFCEIDMIDTIKQLLQEKFVGGNICLPEDLSRFECHLSQPVRIHNVYKIAQDVAKLNSKDVSGINTTIPKENLDLEHVYGEGPYMTLADVILYPLIHITYRVFGPNIFLNHLPLTEKWYKNMQREIKLIDFSFATDLILPEKYAVIQNEIKKQSLYVSDPQRYKPRNRIFTKQPEIMNALQIFENLNISVNLCEKPFGHEIPLNWAQIPLEANPEGGALPPSRMKRKCEQLENLAKPVIKMAKPSFTIIDFCSGSGHLGILLAVKLPDCKVILLENKETSLNRARDRVEKLKLKNVTLLQCNLDYFIGDFDIGVSLHACGVATDLVIQHCLKRNAAFVACPCCYGGVHVCHHISYPRSKIFQDSPLTLHDYLVLGHSADQTHDSENAKTKQGIICMNIIDTDRKLQAEQHGYTVKLAKMIPESCTPKNNILVGIPQQPK